MPRKKEEVKEEVKGDSGFYKGYDLSWLRNEPEHPDFNLVAEFDELHPEEKKEEEVEEVEEVEAVEAE